MSDNVTRLVWKVSHPLCNIAPDTLTLVIERPDNSLISAGEDIQKDCDVSEVILNGIIPDNTNPFYWSKIEETGMISDSTVLDPPVSGLPEETLHISLNLTGQICPLIASDTVEIKTKRIADVFIPNIFTPNDDAFNQYFQIDNQLVDSSLRVYNRWGKLVFEDNNYKNNWRGTNLNNGTYYYMVYNPCAEINPIKGSVSIIK